MRPAAAQRGSTYVETVVAVAIVAVLLPAVYGLADAARRTWALVELRSGLDGQLRRGLGRAARELMNGGNVAILTGAENDELAWQRPLAVGTSGTTWGADGELGWRYRLRVDERRRLVREVLDGGEAVQDDPAVFALDVGPNGSSTRGFGVSEMDGRVRLVLAAVAGTSDLAVSGVVETEVFLRNRQE